MGLEKLKFDKMLVHSYHVSIEISTDCINGGQKNILLSSC